jgi:hypothetical protein
MAPGIKNRLAIVRTSIIFIRVASNATRLGSNATRSPLRMAYRILLPKPPGILARTSQTEMCGWHLSPMVTHRILFISFVDYGMQVSADHGIPAGEQGYISAGT